MRSHNRRQLVVASLLAGTFLSSVDVTVVGTAMPTVVAQLGGLALYPWVFSIYLLASTVTMPLYGKAADLFGRKPAYLVGTGLFVLGSVLCATATSMEQLVLWRGLQGLGAGVTPVTFTIVGDLYPAEKRARIQGLFSAVWAISSIAGPALGALIVSQWTWQWIFLINLPVGVVAAGLLLFSLDEEVERKPHRFDLAGAGFLTAGTVGLLWAMLRGGGTGFADPWVLASLTAALVFAAAFIVQERRHPEPMIPPSLLRDRTVRISALAGLGAGGMLFGISSYVPAFVQGAMGGDVTDAGLSVLAMGIGWPIASTSSGWFLRWWGFRRTALLGGVLLALGGLGLWTFEADTSRLWVMLVVGVIGLGMGFAMTITLIAPQEVVDWQRRGAVTGLVQFSRTIGGTILVAAMGAVLAGTLRSELASNPELIELANAIMDPQRRGAVPTEVAAQVHGAISVGLSRALIGVGAMGLCVCLALLAFPRSVSRPRG